MSVFYHVEFTSWGTLQDFSNMNNNSLDEYLSPTFFRIFRLGEIVGSWICTLHSI